MNASARSQAWKGHVLPVRSTGAGFVAISVPASPVVVVVVLLVADAPASGALASMAGGELATTGGGEVEVTGAGAVARPPPEHPITMPATHTRAKIDLIRCRGAPARADRNENFTTDRWTPRGSAWHERAMLERRAFLEGGLVSLAALLARSVAGCGDSDGDAAPMTATEDGGADGSTADAPASDGEEFPYEPVAKPKLESLIAAIGPLGDPDANGIRVPAGFTARIVAKSATPPVPGKEYAWHSLPDGGATFALADGGFVYVSNSELPIVGGASALRFDASGALVDAYPILQKTNVNCAGGPTPWNTWLSCEEFARGHVHECDPTGKRPAVMRPALGTFKHEAATVDPILHHVYLTEDETDGCLYRYVPDRLGSHGFANLAAGKLEVAEVSADGSVTWHAVPDPNFEGSVPTRLQVAAATHFDGGEGIWWHAGVVYFTAKGDNRVRAYATETQKMTVLYDVATSANPILSGVDNVTVSASGDVIVVEDGGDMQVVAILPSGELLPLAQIVGYPDSELTGPAFDPSGTRLYFSSQRGARGGTTFEITGPFHRTV